MTPTEFVLEAMAQNRQGLLELVQGLAPRQLAWQPADGANTVGFLLLHIFRGEDFNTHTRLVGQPQVWDREGWSNRLRLPPRPSQAGPMWTAGTGWTQQELATFVTPLAELLGYGEAVRQSVTAQIRGLDPTKLDEAPALPANFAPTRARILRMLATHEVEHRGQAEMVLGLMKAQGIR
jgi:hypothetical protein